MSPTETAAILRQFIDWRHDKSNWPTSPMQIEKAIAAAIEMIERLEATEEDRSNFLVEMGKLCAQCDALRLRIEAAEEARDALRVKIKMMEQQKPVGCVESLFDEFVIIHNNFDRAALVYLASGAKGEEK